MQLAPAGTHRAVLYKVVNLGTLPTEFQGQKKQSHKIRLFWELTDEEVTYQVTENGVKVEKTAPFSIGRKFTFSMGDQSHLYPIVTGMIGQGLTEDERWNFDIESLLGMSSLITVVHEEYNGQKFAKVASTAPLLKGMEKIPANNTLEVIDVRKLTKEQIDALPDYIKNDMISSNEYHVRFLAPRGEQVDHNYPTEDINPDDIPF